MTHTMSGDACLANMRIGLLVVTGVVLLVGEVHGQGSVESDRAALEALYNATDGPNWWRRGNWLSDEPLSEWSGVLTDEQGRVRALDLYENQMSGPIPPELGQLTHLESLNLFENRLSGSVPPELGQLTRLLTLQLQQNRLSGPIPPELGQLTGLVYLNLFENQLGGAIPPELGRLTKLHTLQLNENRLSGPIPSELGRSTRLEFLSLYGNELSGSIPPELGQLTRLEILQLNGNELSGSIPSELGRLTHLDILLLYENELSGPLPPELGQLTRMHYLSLYENELSGPLPVELGNLTALTTLRIDGNTGLCMPREMQGTVFGRLAVGQGVPLCDPVTAFPLAAVCVLALALVVGGLRRRGMQRQPATVGPSATWGAVSGVGPGRARSAEAQGPAHRPTCSPWPIATAALPRCPGCRSASSSGSEPIPGARTPASRPRVRLGPRRRPVPPPVSARFSGSPFLGVRSSGFVCYRPRGYPIAPFWGQPLGRALLRL